MHIICVRARHKPLESRPHKKPVYRWHSKHCAVSLWQ